LKEYGLALVPLNAFEGMGSALVPLNAFEGIGSALGSLNASNLGIGSVIGSLNAIDFGSKSSLGSLNAFEGIGSSLGSLNAFEGIGSSLGSLNTSNLGLGSSLGSLNAFEGIGSSLRSLNAFERIGSLVFDNWVKTNIQLFDFLNKRISFAERLDSKILHFLGNYNWFITISLENDFIIDLSQIIKANPNKLAINLRNTFIGYFSENNYRNLKKMVTNWKDNPLFKPRMKIFRDSVNLLKQSQNSYNSANLLIPTLISQIDGILTDYLIENEFTIVKEKGRWIWRDKNLNKINNRNEVYERIFDPNDKNYSLTNGSTSSAALEIIGNDFILNTLFQTAYTKQELKKPFGLSRHKIMHGENTTYGRKDHLFRAFLILDFLYSLENVDC
jgi:hypothetical protein